MYDYEVRDILNRPKHPLIDLEFKVVMMKEEKVDNSYLSNPLAYIIQMNQLTVNL